MNMNVIYKRQCQPQLLTAVTHVACKRLGAIVIGLRLWGFFLFT